MTITVDDFSPGGKPREVEIDLSAPTPALAYFSRDPKVAAELAKRKASGAGSKSLQTLKAAGLAVVADDTGRVLMLQRGLDEGDPASGRWELPGGGIEDGESPEDAATREWSEETGQPVPDHPVTQTWDASNGVYRGHVMRVPSEDAVDLTERDSVVNPDDPDGDLVESIAWWDPEHLVAHPALRDELAADLPMVMQAIRKQSKDFRPDERRDGHGRWTRTGGGITHELAGLGASVADIKLTGSPGGTGTKADPIAVGDNLDRAVELLAQGKHVRLDSPLQIGTLLDKLAAVVRDAEGDHTKTYDLCKVSVPGTNLFCQRSKNVPRAQMPQLKGFPVAGSIAARRAGGDLTKKVSVEDDFRELFKTLGVKVTRQQTLASNLKASQAELSSQGVVSMLAGLREHKVPDRPIFVSRDGYVIDGHHRWAATVAEDAVNGKLGELSMDTEVIDLDIGAVLDLASAFTAAIGIQGKGHGEGDPVKSMAGMTDAERYELLGKMAGLL